jgi:hypothetical protein
MRVEDIEKSIMGLPLDQLVKFRAWYEQFDADNWDTQIAKDVTDGKLDVIAESALAEYKAGKATKL